MWFDTRLLRWPSASFDHSEPPCDPPSGRPLWGYRCNPPHEHRAHASTERTCDSICMDSILTLVPYGENIGADVIEPRHAIRILEELERSLQERSLRWDDVSLLIVADSKAASTPYAQHDSVEGVTAGIDAFCAARSWFPSLIGSSCFASFFAAGDRQDADIANGLLFVACMSSVLEKIPVAHEITRHDAERRLAGSTVLEDAVRGLRKRIQEALGVDIPNLTVTESSIGLIFTTGSGHIEAKEFIDFKDCYAVGQELKSKAADLDAHLYGGCATNRTTNQLQCLYYSEEIGAKTHYRSTFRHGAVLTFLPYTRAHAHLRHPYRHVPDQRLEIEFHPRDQYADGRYFYVRRINGRAPIDFLADYWDYTVAELQVMADNHTPIPSEPGAHLVTIASSLNRYDDNAWPNVPIWLDREGDEVLLRLVRAEADDGNYYLMEMKPEYLADNARDLMSSVLTNFSDDTCLLAFLCESRKYVLNDHDSNAEAEEMLHHAPPNGPVVGIYINGEYSTGAPASIGYHNYSQIGAVIPRRPIDALPANIAGARRASNLELFLCHTSRDKPTVREFANIIEMELPGSVRWMDEKQLVVGDDLRETIRAAIGRPNQYFIPFITDRSVGADWVKREMSWALEEERNAGRTFILPVILDDDGEVMNELKANWKPKLVRVIEDRLGVMVNDFSEEEIATKARALARAISDQAARRKPPSGPHSTLGPMS